MSDSIKLRKLKEIRRKDLEKNLLDVELKGYDHYIFINVKEWFFWGEWLKLSHSL